MAGAESLAELKHSAKLGKIFPVRWVGGYVARARCRVEKTRKQHEHARGTPRDLPRNTQRIISPFIAGGKKE